MTIQNIEDVMDRIMSLNRNLTEESLKTLLSASGWDREDILEGLRIFRATNKSTVTSAPISSQMIDQNKAAEEKIIIPSAKPEPLENRYSFNFKKPDPVVSPELVKKEDLSSSESFVKVDTPNKDTNPTQSVDVKVKSESRELPANEFLSPQSEVIVNTEVKEEKSSHTGRILFYLLLLLLLGLVAAYLYLPAFASFVNQKILGRPATSNIVVKDIPRTYTNPNYIQPNVITPTSTVIAPNGTTSNNSNLSLEELKRELGALKTELENYKRLASSNTGGGQTIVKYISQRGPAGATGRGIATVDATTTGFVINYTDGSRDIVPYSTTTMLQILNSKGVCFRDLNSEIASSSDVCLDKNAVMTLLNK